MIQIIGTNDDKNSKLYAKAIVKACNDRDIAVEYIEVTSEMEFLKYCAVPVPTLVLEPCAYEIPNIPYNLEQNNTARAILKECQRLREIQRCELSVLVVNRSELIGKPLFNMLLDDNFTVTVAHSKTMNMDMKALIKAVDVVVFATGHDQEYRIYDKYVIDISNDFKGTQKNLWEYIDMRSIGKSTIEIMLDDVYKKLLENIKVDVDFSKAEC